MLFVGDLSDGDLRLTRRIASLPYPLAVILGNHDLGRDRSGGILRQQLALLGETHCGWTQRGWHQPAIGLVGARPGSAGGGFHLSRAVQAVYGPITLEQSADRIVAAAAAVSADQPLIVMAHCGPVASGPRPTAPAGVTGNRRRWTGAIRISPSPWIGWLGSVARIWWSSATCIIS